MKIQDYMTAQEAADYGLAAGLAAAAEPDRDAWLRGEAALLAAEMRAIAAFCGPVRVNRHGRPWGAVHPAIAGLDGYYPLSGCWEDGNDGRQ